LGYAAYRQTSENGYNQREEDVLAALAQAIDKIIELRPDFVIHAGDLFHTVRPTNRIIHFAIEQILRLVRAQIPTVIISGNHETPKQRYIGNVFKILEGVRDALPAGQNLLQIVYKMQYETIKIGKATIHAIPQCRNGEEFNRELAKVKPDTSAEKNILVLHCGVKGMREFAQGDFNELLVDYEYLAQSPFDYIALGHFHNFSKVTQKAFFSGSTERMSFNEAGFDKGLLVVDLEKPFLAPANPCFHPLKIRPMLELDPIDAQHQDAAAIGETVDTILRQNNLTDKIVRIKVKNIQPSALAILDTKKIREAAQTALHFEPIFEKAAETGAAVTLQTSIGGVVEEFIAFMHARTDLDPAYKKDLLEQGIDYLNRAMEESEK